MSGERPLLLHLAMSHYNEKARWALDHKRIDHTRRAVIPGVHVAIAMRVGGEVAAHSGGILPETGRSASVGALGAH